MLCGVEITQTAPFVINTNLQIRLVMNTATADGAAPIRLAKDPRDNHLYYLKRNGDIYSIDLQPSGGISSIKRVYGATDHGISEGAQGMAIGPSGAIYVVGNMSTNNGNSTFARIMIGTPNATGGRDWGLVAQSEPYPRGNAGFDHGFGAVVVSLDGRDLYVSSGSRTDHGEVQSAGGVFPNVREVPLTACIFPLPAYPADLILFTNGFASGGPQSYTGKFQPEPSFRAYYPFAYGLRNCTDLAFAPNGELFGTEEGTDRDMSGELNWIQQAHFGFPWRMGSQNNPQQFSNYDPSKDKLLDPRYAGVSSGSYHNDPTFPATPASAQFSFTDPVINIGPDADSFRDPTDGQIKDASNLGLTLSTFTPHRSPVGLVFDTSNALAPPFYQHGFVLSRTSDDASGTTVADPFGDSSEDMLDLELTKLGATNYQAKVTRIVGGFTKPIDAEIIGNKIYVLESGGDQSIWEVTFPARPGNDAPTISPVGDAGYEGQAFLRGTLFIADAGPNFTPTANLQLTGTSSNQALVPDSNITFFGAYSYRYPSIDSVPGQIGETIITLTVTDRGPGPPKSASTSFKITVVPFNQPPVISSIADQAIERNTSTAVLPFTISDAETPADKLVLNAGSDNENLVPSQRIVLKGSGTSRTVRVIPTGDQYGAARVTINVLDGGGKSASTSFSLTVPPPPIVKGDLNQDARADLIFEDDDGFLATWSMSGAEMSSPSLLIPSQVGDGGFRVVGSGDFNGDRQEDLLFQHADGTLAVWFMQGTTLSTAALLNPSDPGDKDWRVVATGDIDRDGHIDLVFQHKDGTLAVWYMDGLVLSRAVLTDPAHPGDAKWRVVGIGDFNGDGKSDLIFQHADGTLAAWFMDGAKLKSAALLDPSYPGDVNWRVVAAGQYGKPFATTLSGSAVRPTPVTTTASGSGKLTLAGRQLTFDIKYSGLSGPVIGAHFHWPATDEQAAGILLDLAPFRSGVFGTSGSFEGTVTLTDDGVRYVPTGQAYVNIHTEAYRGGELRGQILGDAALAGKVDLIFQHEIDQRLAIWFLDGTKLRAAQFLNPPNPGGSWRVVAPK